MKQHVSIPPAGNFIRVEHTAPAGGASFVDYHRVDLVPAASGRRKVVQVVSMMAMLCLSVEVVLLYFFLSK